MCSYSDGGVEVGEEMSVMAWISQMQGIVVFPDLFSYELSFSVIEKQI